jgi:phosphatidylserine decarboxylase
LPPFFQAFLPHNAISWLAGVLANSNVIWLKNYLIRYFINRYPVNLSEAEESNPFAYASYNDFFTRSLKPTLRPIASGLHDFASPADGQISQFGSIEYDLIFQAKKHFYTTSDLLGGNADTAKAFLNGHFVTIYLAPKDYHRVHMPIDGQLFKMIYIPGKLFSVNHRTTNYTPNLFARNERVVALFHTSIGDVAMVLVGAMIVGSIETVWAGTITPPHRNRIQFWDYNHPISLKRGEEMGRFKLGSTVIVLTEADTLEFDPTCMMHQDLKMGERIGSFTARAY